MKIAKNGFTLAEVLITLGIIGVVAALTIPTLMQNIQDKELYTATQKTFSVLSNVTQRIVYENSGTLWDNSSSDTTVLSKSITDEYAKYLSYVQEDTSDKIQTNGWYGYKSNKIVSTPVSTRYSLVLKDGMYLRFLATQNCISPLSTGIGNVCGSIIVDVNGNKSPNMWGRDVQAFDVIKDNNGNYKLLPCGPDVSGHNCSSNSQDITTSQGCTEYVINNQPLPQ